MLFYINIDILNKTIKNVGDLFLHSRSCVVFLQIVLLARTLHVLQSLPSRKHPHKLHLIDKMNCRVNRKFINGTTKSFVDGGKLHLSAE